MNFFLNELSLHDQFKNLESFLSALTIILACKDDIIRSGFQMYCERTITNRPVIQGTSFVSVILGYHDHNFKRKVRIWLERTGPFWDKEDLAHHNPDDYFEFEEEPLESASLAEAAFQIATNQNQCATLSFSPSEFEKTPLQILWHKSMPPLSINVPNFWDRNALNIYLKGIQPPAQSWVELLEHAKIRFTNLIFLESIIEFLEGEPFSDVIAKRVMVLLNILNELASCFDEAGNRTQRGQEIYYQFFTGDTAIFSDESSTNKQRFQKELTFKTETQGDIFCPFHGKISHRVFRLHFTWPIRYNEPVYVAYIGPKITKG